jgi:ankyrin repeat protein
MLFWRKSVAAAVSVSAASAFLLLSASSGCDRSETAGTGQGRGDKSAGGQSTRAALPVVSRQPPSTSDSEPATQLYRALLYANTTQVRQVLEQRPDLANAQINGTRPLAQAGESGQLELVQALVEKGAQINVKAGEDWSVLWWAVRGGSVEVVKYLILKGGDPLARETDGETLLWAAPNKEMAQFLISRGVDPKARDKFNDTALHAACRNSKKDVVELLLNAGIHVETKGRWDMPPLHSAACTLTGDPRPIVHLLLSRGANVNSRGFEGHTALHETAFFNCLEMADLLLTHGADPNLKDSKGRTPVDSAILAGKRERVRIINLLIRNGAPGQLLREEE